MFWAIEGQAVREGKYKGTLTYKIRFLFSMEGKGKWWRLRRVMLLAMLAWINAHLIFPAGTF